ncbi:uncharacterized protein HD556DRAFT_1311979 [Suillus plorans]|uniref:Uncharacterized protein n=1 Tax=Suillus plorans TaxID=116603 RepID=A0A9P7DDM2_9AGAM|nr:uncharacterized protein HD556DRAFT_1311979 [Suillus plorans]KAG1788568.1 hypothetical protein HD556DRAFT_1311979 [Suillus plorans]
MSQPNSEDSTMLIEDQQNGSNIHEPSLGQAQPAFVQARQRRKIAELEGKLEALESGRTGKERSGHHWKTNYYLAQGRGFRRVVALFDSIEDLVSENDRRYDDIDDEDATFDQERLLTGYNILTRTLPWLLKTTSGMEHDDYTRMLKTGADSARGDDTAKLKALVADWVNREFKPNPPLDSDNKHCRGFISDVCGGLLCPAELDWYNPA